MKTDDIRPHIVRLHLIRKIDNLKSNWYVWECEAEMPNGDLIHGSVQADYQGELADSETFEVDE